MTIKGKLSHVNVHDFVSHWLAIDTLSGGTPLHRRGWEFRGDSQVSFRV